MNRTRTTAAVLATAGLVTAAQLGLGTAASAAPHTARTPQAGGCPIDLVYPSRFYVDSHGWVTNGGLYFGIKNKSTTKNFGKVTFTVTDVKNIRFGHARATGGKVTKNTSKTVSVYASTLKKKASLGLKVPTHLLNTRSYKVKFTLRGTGWNCAVDQGTWGV
ncbi:hypothetical protein J2Z21_004669 [Streptomyces griseochromogenes]|uniref:Lipoprotein n=1 Tax=Streptomyces griseochromogenes TaxID=68214 RepID=A0A1B1ATA8_9ACTN|nr:hypothetical protein [Streptomyces griseochromogenes]ANP49818.1 hypothetical protein AVL59_09515 [Streptomyces griseochromogenes]MBP2051692.1 hypothetical protein [Streptomyces griseochromogenes]